MHAVFWLVILKQLDPLEEFGHRWQDKMKVDLKEILCKVND